MTVYFTGDQENIANRLLGSAVLKDQTGARTKLYVSTKSYVQGVSMIQPAYLLMLTSTSAACHSRSTPTTPQAQNFPSP